MIIFLSSGSNLYRVRKYNYNIKATTNKYAAVVELVDTRDSKSRASNSVSVRARPAVPIS